jgi:hypothetical protein
MRATGELRGKIIEVEAGIVPTVIVPQPPAMAVHKCPVNGPMKGTANGLLRVAPVMLSWRYRARGSGEDGATKDKSRYFSGTHDSRSSCILQSYNRHGQQLFAERERIFSGLESRNA